MKQKIALLLFLCTFLYAEKSISIGILSDYKDQEWNRRSIELLETEISRSVGPSKSFIFAPSDQLYSTRDTAETADKYYDPWPGPSRDFPPRP